MLQVQCLRIFVGSACMMLLQLEGRGFGMMCLGLGLETRELFLP